MDENIENSYQFKPGDRIGKFLIEEIIGSGATGTVYKAKDDLDRIVALKILNKSLSVSSDFRARFFAEAKAAAKINSEYVARIWEYASVDDIYYISLEYVSRDDLLTISAKMSMNQRLELLQHVAEGIQVAHQAGLIHGDLKPQNILISAAGIPKILDFGLAKNSQDIAVDQFGNIEGTLFYMAPEQLEGSSASFLSDLYSFGVIMYEILTEKRPFDADYPAAVIYAVLHEDPPIPTELKSEIPAWLNDLIMKLISREPKNRFDGIDTIINYFRRGMRGELGSLTSVSFTRQTVTVIDLKNLSGDGAWDYFCIGFTEDLIRELARRTDLSVSAEPATKYQRNIEELFKVFRTDFIIAGSLMNMHDLIRLSLSVYGKSEKQIISTKNYESDEKNVFNLLTQAVEDTSNVLSKIASQESYNREGLLETDIAAYDFYLRGRSFYHANTASVIPENLNNAETMFRKALQVDPNLASAYSGLSDVYIYQYTSYIKRDFSVIEKAREEAQKAISIAPDLPEAHRSLGRYFMSIREYDSARTSLLRAVDLDPKYAIGYRTLAWFNELTGDHDEALNWASIALRYARHDIETLLLIGLINIDLRRYTIALATLQRAIELAPDCGRAYYYLGAVYIRLGVVELAIENFLSAVKYQGDPNAYIDAGYTMILRGNYDSAQELLNESIRLNYFSFIAHYYLGLIKHLLGHAKEAIEYFEKAMELTREILAKDPRDMQILAILSLACAAAGKNDDALQNLNKLHGFNCDGQALYTMARAYALLGEFDKANDFIAKALAEHAGPSKEEIQIDPHFKGFKPIL
jgi:serine/threonine protein kinase/Flp pilus assembly protein TadD